VCPLQELKQYQFRGQNLIGIFTVSIVRPRKVCTGDGVGGVLGCDCGADGTRVSVSVSETCVAVGIRELKDHLKKAAKRKQKMMRGRLPIVTCCCCRSCLSLSLLSLCRRRLNFCGLCLVSGIWFRCLLLHFQGELCIPPLSDDLREKTSSDPAVGRSVSPNYKALCIYLFCVTTPAPGITTAITCILFLTTILLSRLHLYIAKFSKATHTNNATPRNHCTASYNTCHALRKPTAALPRIVLPQLLLR